MLSPQLIEILKLAESIPGLFAAYMPIMTQRRIEALISMRIFLFRCTGFSSQRQLNSLQCRTHISGDNKPQTCLSSPPWKIAPLFLSTKLPICVSVFHLNNNTEHKLKMGLHREVQEKIRSYLKEHNIDLDSLDISDEMKQSTMEDIAATAVGAVTEAVLADPRLVAKMATIRASAAGRMDAVEANLDQIKDEIVSFLSQKLSGALTNS